MLYINDLMITPPVGTLKNSANFTSGNGYVQLTAAINNTWGEVEYFVKLPKNYVFEADFYANGGADANFVYWGCSSTPISEDTGYGGYLVALDEYNSDPIGGQGVLLQFNGTVLASALFSNLGNGTVRTLKVVVTGQHIQVYVAGALVLDYTDISRSLPGNLVGIGARTGGVNAEHRCYRFILYDLIIGPYSVTINGVDRSKDILANSIVTQSNLNDRQDNCHFLLVDRNGLGIPQNEQELIITLADGTRIFAGIILKVEVMPIKDYGAIAFQISAVDYVRLLDSNLVHKNYTGMTDSVIIKDILATYCVGSGITGNNIITGVTLDQISFNYLQVSQALKKICQYTARNWFIDYYKDIHYIPAGQDSAPINISDSGSDYFNLHLSIDNSQLKNRVYVRGGTKLSDTTSYSTKGDGTTRKFVVPDKPHAIAITVNGVNKTCGVKNVDLSGFDWYVNFDEKYFEQDAGGTTLTSSDTFVVSYTYDIPILVAVENTASIMQNGVKEFAIFDKSITTSAAATARAQAELTDYANGLNEGDFSTRTTGWRIGQQLTVNSPSRGVTNQTYIVQSVTGYSEGGGTFRYDITLASAKTMGIIKFLISILENNQNLVAIATNEIVDNLQSVADSLLSDSLTDNLVIDSAGPYSTWAPDSITLTPKTIAKWDLFQWG